jgi:2-polyprenyl-3-methyl-5-hydroxy-6-metoxy-1,4-benzoquinol methylase
VLEVASSSGQAIREIAKSGYCTVASDVALLPLKHCARISSCVQFDVSQKFPFESHSFNAVFMGEIIEHVFDTGLLLKECNRVLCDDGVLIITTPNLGGLQDRIALLLGYAPRQVNPTHDYLNLHIRPFTFKLLRRVLREAKFEVHELRSNFVRIRFASGGRLNSRLLARLFPTLGGSLIVMARKIRE